jgi:branched-chain amino acid transport system permease protein
MGTSLGMEGFAAAAIGGLGSLGGAVAGGLLLGVVQNVGVTLFGGAALQVVTFAAVLIAFWLRSRHAPPAAGAAGAGFFGLRAHVSSRPLATIALAAPAFCIPLFCGPYVLRVGSEVAIYATLGLSLTLVAGTCGTISLGQVGLFAIGAYASALLEKDLGWTFWCAAPAGAVVAALIAALAVAPVARLGGQELAIATFAIGATIVALILDLDPLTNGPLGISGLPPPVLFGHAIVSARDDYLLAIAAFFVCLLFVERLQSSPLGLTWRAIRDDVVAAAASGISPAAYKTLAFALGGGIAGAAGSVLAAQYLYVSPDIFDSNLSVLALTIVVLGGMGNAWGALLGAAVLVGAPEVFRPLHDYRILAYGIALLLLVRFRPQGFLAYR